MRVSLRATVLTIVFLVGGNGVVATGQAQAAVDTAAILQTPITGRALPCQDGRIKLFRCQNVELLSYIPANVFGGPLEGRYDIWGWTDSLTKREFVLIGGLSGTGFVDVTDPVNPVFLGRLLYRGGVQGKTGIKVYKHYAFIVAELVDEGMQIFDLTQLRNVQGPPVTFEETAHYDDLGNVHTLALNEATGFAYANGSAKCGGGLYMLDVRTPTEPKFAGCGNQSYVHDAQCVVYRGPDRQYDGREICVAYAVGSIAIIDVTDKKAPKTISTPQYPQAGYIHQGWFTDDQRYVYLDDEADEFGQLMETPPRPGLPRTIGLDLTDLDDPVVLTEFYGTVPATDHNLYIRGRYMYQSNYTAGFRIIDIHDPRKLKEVGYLDTAPTLDGVGWNLGSWGNYPFLKNNVVAVASAGLFLVRLRR